MCVPSGMHPELSLDYSNPFKTRHLNFHYNSIRFQWIFKTKPCTQTQCVSLVSPLLVSKYRASFSFAIIGINFFDRKY